jgi:hypothetical protein
LHAEDKLVEIEHKLKKISPPELQETIKSLAHLISEVKHDGNTLFENYNNANKSFSVFHETTFETMEFLEKGLIKYNE